MDLQTFAPHPDLKSIIKHYWTLKVPQLDHPQRQLILPDGNIDLIFMLGEDVKRYTSKTDFILQPRAMVLGPITQKYYIEPTGAVESFAVCFYPYGFANFVSVPIKSLADTETELSTLFEQQSIATLENDMINAEDTPARIRIIEKFLLKKLNDTSTIDQIVKSTVEAIIQSKGVNSIGTILKEDQSKRRQLERKFRTQVGLSPKQLSRVIRLQATLKMMLNRAEHNLTNIAYESGYYDQSHFIKDFKDFTGINPKEFIADENMALSSLLYAKD